MRLVATTSTRLLSVYRFEILTEIYVNRTQSWQIHFSRQQNIKTHGTNEDYQTTIRKSIPNHLNIFTGNSNFHFLHILLRNNVASLPHTQNIFLVYNFFQFLSASFPIFPLIVRVHVFGVQTRKSIWKYSRDLFYYIRLLFCCFTIFRKYCLS